MTGLSKEHITKIHEPRGVYVYVNLCDLDGSQLLNVVLELHEVLQEFEFGKDLIYTEMTNIQISARSLPNLRNIVKNNQKYINKSAVIGLPSFVKALFSTYKKIVNTEVVLFETKEEALDYLFS